MNPADRLALFISLMVTVVITSWVVFRYLATTGQARGELTTDQMDRMQRILREVE